MTHEYWEGKERARMKKGYTPTSSPPYYLEAIVMTWGKLSQFAEKLLENEESLNFRIRNNLEILCYNPFISETRKG